MPRLCTREVFGTSHVDPSKTFVINARELLHIDDIGPG